MAKVLPAFGTGSPAAASSRANPRMPLPQRRMMLAAPTCSEITARRPSSVVGHPTSDAVPSGRMTRTVSSEVIDRPWQRSTSPGGDDSGVGRAASGLLLQALDVLGCLGLGQVAGKLFPCLSGEGVEVAALRAGDG